MYIQPNPSDIDKSSEAFHRKSYQLFQPFMDRTRFGTMMLVLRQKDLRSGYLRDQAGLDIVDIISAGIYNGNYQQLLIHSWKQGNQVVELKHTYKYWAQVVTLKELAETWYPIHIPKLSHSKKENGLLTCIELDDNHECYLRERYVVRTFRLKPNEGHRCPEEARGAPTNSVVATMEHGKGLVCAYCIAEKLNINL